MRGNAGQHAHAAIGGRRLLCQSLNAELSVKGIHICHIYIDAPIERLTPSANCWGRNFIKAIGGTRQWKRYAGHSEKVAETYYHIAHQHRSVGLRSRYSTLFGTALVE